MSVEQIEGIGPSSSEKLAKAGIRGVTGLLKKGGTPQGRNAIAEAAGISTALLLKWVNMADLFRISGISSQYSELLEAAGVDTVKELAQRNPENLYKALAETNAQRKLVRQVPGLARVSDWVQQAKQLPRAVSY